MSTSEVVGLGGRDGSGCWVGWLYSGSRSFEAVEAFDEENRIKAARELRDSAVSRAERFFSKDGFVFNAVIPY